MLANKLKLGDTIGIIAPSSAITKDRKDQFLKGVTKLKKLGFKIKLGEHIYTNYNNWGISAGTPEQRANDINKMFVDNEVKAIMCARGGETSNSVLDLLNYKIIKQHPKIFTGFSDSTTLVNAIYNKTGLITFYGPDVRSHLGVGNTSYTETELLARFTEGYRGEVNKNSLWEEIRPGKAKGRLVGGNLTSILYLINTPYFPKTKNNILFLEGYSSSPAKTASQLHQLNSQKVWNKVNGAIIGYHYGQETSKTKPYIEHILTDITKNYDFPILKIRDIGHKTECTPIPIGVKAKIDTSKLSFIIKEKYLK